MTTLLPSKHAGTRNDRRHSDRAALYTNADSEVVAAETREKKWDRDHEAAERLRNYCAQADE
jgi:hypothetical protein